MDVANLYFILGRENGRKAGTHATWVLASCTEMGAVEPSTLSPLVVKGTFVWDAGPQRRGSEKAELIVLCLHKRVLKSCRALHSHSW